MANPLLNELFDYAGVFPPASHSVAEAAARYHAAKTGRHGWLLGPMLLRATQLAEFDSGTDVGVVVDVDPDDLPAGFLQAERRVAPDDIASIVARLARVAPVVYVESTDAGAISIVDEIAAARATGIDVRAKIRTGGASAESFPSSGSVAAFIAACVDRHVPFKATAGLHHPFRSPSDVDEATEHGFINLLAAVRCALAGESDAVEACLDEVDPAAFDTATMSWGGVGTDVQAEEVRAAFRSIGSCSFDEPARYLMDLGMLEST